MDVESSSSLSSGEEEESPKGATKRKTTKSISKLFSLSTSH